MLAFIWAESKNGVIGSHNQLPWHIPDDTSYFKQLTTNHPGLTANRVIQVSISSDQLRLVITGS